MVLLGEKRVGVSPNYDGTTRMLCVGLTLIANVQQDQYVTEVGTTAGLIVLIQTQNLMPFPEDRGKLVSPGYQTEIAITQVRQQNYSLS